MPGPQQALPAAYDSWNAGDLDGYLRLYDEGIRLHGYSPGPMDGSGAGARVNPGHRRVTRRS